MVTISVIIPAYNQAGYLGYAIQSVLDQSFTDFELVVVNDGSTDHTQDVLTEFQDRRLRIAWQENGGLLAARNTGLSLTTAPYVTFLDADDLFLPNKLELMHDYLNRNSDIGMVVGGTRYIDSGGKMLSEKIAKPSSFDLSRILMDNPITVSGVLIRRGWIDRVGGFETRRKFDPCGDWDLWLRLATAGCQIYWLEQPVVAYRIHPNQMTQDPSWMRDSMLTVLDKFFSQNDLPDELVKLKHQAYASVLVKSAARAYHASLFEMGKSDLSTAVELDKSLKKKDYQELVDRLVGWAQSPQSLDPEGFLVRIVSNLPTSLYDMKPALHKAIAAVTLEPLFGNTLQIRRAGKWALIRAIRNDPSWLRNRGVLRMLIEAWFPLMNESK